MGLTFVKWRTLDTLVKSGDAVHLTVLAETLNCVKSNVTQLVDKLEHDGVVRRIPDPADRRSTLVALTDNGGAAHRAGRAALESATQSVFASFGDADRASLRGLLQLLDG